MKTCIVAFSPFTDMDLFVPLDLLGRAAVLDPKWSVSLVSSEALLEGSTGVQVQAQLGLESLSEAELVVIVSGRGVRRVLKLPDVVDSLRVSALPRLRGIASLDSGALLLAASGWLTGQEASTHPTARAELECLGARYVARPLTIGATTHVDGRTVQLATAGGCLSALPLVGWILRTWGNKELSDRVLVSAASVRPI